MCQPKQCPLNVQKKTQSMSSHLNQPTFGFKGNIVVFLVVVVLLLVSCLLPAAAAVAVAVAVAAAVAVVVVAVAVAVIVVVVVGAAVEEVLTTVVVAAD